MKNNKEWTYENLDQSILESLDFGISIHDCKCNILYQNNILKNIFNGRGNKCYEVYEQKKSVCRGCPVKNAFKRKSSHTSERVVNMPSGEKGYWEYTVKPVRNAEGKFVAYLEIAKDVTERKKSEAKNIEALDVASEELIAKSKKLEEINIAMKVLLEQREIDKKDLESKILTNIKMLIVPYIERLKLNSSAKNHMNYISILESNLMHIVSSLSSQLSSDIYSLTPKEVEVCNLIREGKQSKEIAEIMQVSFETINCHRQNIRKKLGLNNSKINLRAFIASLSE